MACDGVGAAEMALRGVADGGGACGPPQPGALGTLARGVALARRAARGALETGLLAPSGVPAPRGSYVPLVVGHPSAPLSASEVLAALAACAALMVAVLFVARRALEAVAGAVLPARCGRATRRKWARAAIEALYYGANIVLTVAMLSREGLWRWCFDFATPAEEHNSLYSHGFSPSAPPALVFLVLLEGAWYAAQIAHVSHGRFVSGEARSDWREMLAHHAVALGLVAMVCINGHWRLAPPLTLAHNISDPPLHVAKLFKYSAVEPHATVLFGIFVLVFFVSRLVYYPALILNALYHYHAGIYQMESERTWMEIAGICTMSALVPIHIFWFGLIVRMIFRLFAGTMDADIRSDDDEAEHQEGDARQRADVELLRQKRRAGQRASRSGANLKATRSGVLAGDVDVVPVEDAAEGAPAAEHGDAEFTNVEGGERKLFRRHA